MIRACNNADVTSASASQPIRPALSPLTPSTSAKRDQSQSGTIPRNVGHSPELPETATIREPVQHEGGTIPRNVGHAVKPACGATGGDHEPNEGETNPQHVGHSPALPREKPHAEESESLLLHEKKELALAALLQGLNNTEAAQAAGVDRRTIYRWKQDPVFQGELRSRQKQMGIFLHQFLASLASESVAVLKESLVQGDVDSALKLVGSLQLFEGKSLTQIEDLADPASPEVAVPFIDPPAAAPAATVAEPTPDTGKKQLSVDLLDLPLPQQVLVTELAAGKALYVIANQTGLALSTLVGWIREEMPLRQVLLDYRRDQAESLQAKLVCLGYRAISVLEHEVKVNRNRRAAFAVLRRLGLL